MCVCVCMLVFICGNKRESEVKELVTQSGPTFGDAMDCSLPGSSVHRVLQARILEWLAIPFSRDLPNLEIEPGSPTLRQIHYHLSHQEAI